MAGLATRRGGSRPVPPPDESGHDAGLQIAEVVVEAALRHCVQLWARLHVLDVLVASASPVGAEATLTGRMSAWNGTIAGMTITIPSGQPNSRFMRFVRAPVRDSEELPPLFPLRPATRPLRLGIDTTTVPVPPDGYLSRFFGRDEIEVQLLVPAGEEVRAAWTEALHQPLVRQIGFTSIENAGRELAGLCPIPTGMAVGVAGGLRFGRDEDPGRNVSIGCMNRITRLVGLLAARPNRSP